MTRRRRHAVRRTALTAVLAGTCLGPLAACTVGGPQATGPGPASGTPVVTATATTEPEPEPVVTHATIDRIDGQLAAGGRDRLRARVLAAVDAWFDGAYGGSYPREDFSDAFTSFTDAAVERALEDEDLMSNASLGSRLDEVRPVRRRVRIDVLGVDGRAVAVTAQVVLGLQLSGEVTRRDRISGSLYLTYEKSGRQPGWRVFGYDISREAV